MILEGIVTTRGEGGEVNISPMGPIVDEAMERIVLRPFNTSTTYRNLKRTRHGVLHVTDDVWLLAQAAVGKPDPPPRLVPVADLLAGATSRGSDDALAEIAGEFVIADACRWYAFHVAGIDDAQERVTIAAEVVAAGVLRDFFGFNRAKHAVVEAAILATRVHLLPADEIAADMQRLRPLVVKTGGATEHRAFTFLDEHIARSTR